MGLTVGSPVLWEGVQIGSVTNISIIADLTKGKSQIPVVVEILPARFIVVRGERSSKNLQRLIDRGLRAVLTTQSFITGQLAIEVGFYPNTPVVLRKKLGSQYEDLPEIPTIPSTTQRLMQALEKLDLKAIEHNLDSALEGISNLANDPNLLAAIKGLKDTMQTAHKLLVRMDKKIDPLAKNANKTVKDIGILASSLDTRVKELSTTLNKTLSSAEGTLSSLDKTMKGVRGVISPNSPLVFDLENSLQQIGRMSEALRELADYLEQHPSSIIRGKKKNGGNKQ
jgi:paraquat-inducible protein B